MVDLFRQGAEWLEQQRRMYCSSIVEYRRQSESKNVYATYGRTSFEIASESGLTINAQTWDFLILASDLAFEPAPGDVIVADGHCYEVMNLGAEGCWSWSGPFRLTYRIHTKDTGPDI